MTCVHFPVDEMTGYTSGYGGLIMKTTNGGTSWLRQTSGTSYNLFAVHFPLDVQTGYVVGGDVSSNGCILKTTDGGATWNRISGLIDRLWSVHFPVDDQTGYAVGENGFMCKTTNGGTSWASLPRGPSFRFYCVRFPRDVQTGFATGSGGVIIKTTDGGTTWSMQTSGASFYSVASVSFQRDATTGYAVGNGGVILKTTDGGASFVEEKTEARGQWLEVRLEVTPNPFGEETHISYQLSAPSPVNLTIYNIAGQVVKVLGRAHGRAPLQPSGTYQVAWDGRDERGRWVPAGVYLIRLEAGEHKETGRVVLIR